MYHGRSAKAKNTKGTRFETDDTKFIFGDQMFNKKYKSQNQKKNRNSRYLSSEPNFSVPNYTIALFL